MAIGKLYGIDIGGGGSSSDCVLIDGTRQLTGTWNYGSQTISGTGDVYTSGKIGVGTTSPTESFEVYPDTDASSVIGRAHIGFLTGLSDNASFSHVDVDSASSYALTQNHFGDTRVNCASGRQIYFSTNATQVGRFAWNGFFLSAGIRLGTDQVRAIGSSGLSLMEDGATLGVFIEDSTGDVGIKTNSPTAGLDVNDDVMRLRTSKTVTNSTDTGTTGDICWDSGYIYVCVATNTWKRAAINTWGA